MNLCFGSRGLLGQRPSHAMSCSQDSQAATKHCVMTCDLLRYPGSKEGPSTDWLHGVWRTIGPSWVPYNGPPYGFIPYIRHGFFGGCLKKRTGDRDWLYCRWLGGVNHAIPIKIPFNHEFWCLSPIESIWANIIYQLIKLRMVYHWCPRCSKSTFPCLSCHHYRIYVYTNISAVIDVYANSMMKATLPIHIHNKHPRPSES